MYVRGNPLRYNDPSGHQACMAMAPVAPLVLGCQAGELAMRYGPTVLQLAAQWADKIPGAVDWMFSSNTAQNAPQNVPQGGNTTNPSGDPNDPFRTANAAIQKGVNTLRGQINNLSNWTIGRYGAQAHLSRAEYYQQQGVLQSVNPTGARSIDLLLNNNTGVEVKYWSAQRVFADIQILADQFRGFGGLGLDHVVVEFVQTQNKPVTQAVLGQLQTQLSTQFGVNLSNFTFTIVSNPGIP